MNHKITALILVFVCLLTMSGCTTANAVHKLEAAEENMEAKLDMVEDLVEGKLDVVDDPIRDNHEKESAAVPEKNMTTVVPPVTESTMKISKEDAQQIALNYVGLTKDQVTRMHTEYEIDDRIPQYDVEFRQGNLEYEFEIHAESGAILSFDKDYD